jgi:hypothetical protein
LVGGAAATGAIAVGVLTKAAPASADNGNPLLLGTNNTATLVTYVANTSNQSIAFRGDCTKGVGVVGVGVAGVFGQGTEGVYGNTTSGGSAPGSTVNGVHGICDIAGNGVWGESVDAGSGAGNGVYGSTNSAGASGVYGHNAGTGFGVAGRAESGTGTLGDSTNGVGVAASSQNGTGLRATTAFGTAGSFIETGGGTALSVVGPAVFNRSGLVTIAAPAKSASVAVPGGLATTSLVFALVQNAVPGVSVANAIPNPATGKVTINLNKVPPSTSPSAKVGWFVLG